MNKSKLHVALASSRLSCLVVFIRPDSSLYQSMGSRSLKKAVNLDVLFNYVNS